MRSFTLLISIYLSVLISASPDLAGGQLIELTIRDLKEGGHGYSLLNDMRGLSGVRNITVDWPTRAIQLELGSGDTINVFGIASMIADRGFTLTQFNLEADGTLGEELDTTYFYLQSGQGFLVRRNTVVNEILDRTEEPVRVKGRITGWRKSKSISYGSDQAPDPFLTIISYRLPEQATK